MPRDVHNAEQPFEWYGRYTYRSGYVTPIQHADGSTKFTVRLRDNAKSTAKGSDGRYHRPSAYYASSSTVVFSPYKCSYTRTGKQDPSKGEFWGSGFQLGSNWRAGGNSNGVPVCSAEAIAKVRSLIRSRIADSDLDLGVYFGELRETVATMKSIVDDVLRFTKAFKGRVKPPKSPKGPVNRKREAFRNWGRRVSSRLPKGNRTTVSDAERIANNAAKEYLRYIYGIKPFMNDLWALATHAESLIMDGEIVVVSAMTRDPAFSADNLLWSYFDKWEGECYRELRSEVAFSVANAYRFELWRMGLTNPASIAWELMSLSFVVDWFTGLGNWLGGLQRPQGLKFLWGYETHYIKKDGTFFYRVPPEGATYIIHGNPYATARIRHVGFQRVLLDTFTGPPPFFRMDLGIGQVVSGLALIGARIR